MQSSGISYDPFLILGEYLGQSGYRNTTGRTKRSLAINSSDSTLVLLNAGQSNAMNVVPSPVTLTNASVIDNFNVYDGGLYDSNGLMLGTDIGGQSTIVQRVADLLVTNGRFDRIIVAPLAISGTPIAIWGNGGVLADRIPLAMRRLASRGIVPGMTGVTFALLWMQGEADNSNGTSQGAYEASFGQIKANAISAGFSGRIFVTTETHDASITSSAIQAAQAAVRDNVTVFDGGNLDSLDDSYRQDTIHFNDAGAAAAATLIEAAMHASGSPF
jgi:hypothetical protein